jgi:ElaB/YqjD/DUF883 family membrane-anchored ribosome-binding protein
MSENRSAGAEGDVHSIGTAGGASTGATDVRTGHDTSNGLTTSSAGVRTGAHTAREGLAGTTQEYGQRIADAASQARDYVSDRVSAARDKIGGLQGVDYRQIAEDAKEYARRNPGRALLISASAGFLLGLLLRGRPSARPPGDPTIPPPPPRRRR